MKLQSSLDKRHVQSQLNKEVLSHAESTVLLENRNAKETDGLLCRPGLSLLIEDGETRILFDAGPDASFMHNAKKWACRLMALTGLYYPTGTMITAVG